MKIIELNEDVMSSIKEVTEILKGGNYQTVRKKIGKVRVRKLLLKLYPKHTRKEIEAITGIPDSTLGYWFRRLGINSKIRWHTRSASKPGNRDSVRLKRNNGIISKLATVKITPELAYVVGFTLGDGSVQKYMVEVFNKDENLRHELYKFLKPYGTITEDRREYGLWRLRLSSGRIADLIKRDKEPNRKTIEYIFGKNKLARKFIAAFWDAEGSVRREGRQVHVYLYNSDTYLLDKVEKFLKSKDIGYSKRHAFESGREYYLKGRKVISKKKVYRISIPKSSLERWVRTIGVHMLHSKKKRVVEEILDKGGMKWEKS